MMKIANMKKTFAALLAALAVTGTVMTGISASASDCNYFSISHVPDKTVYSTGEELDLTGGKAFASGQDDGKYCGSSERPFDFFTVDASAFNNQVPGTYTIYISCGDATDSFTVEVTDRPTGDANGDGKTDIADALLLNKAILGKVTLTDRQLKAVDFNHNGTPDSSDSLVLMKYITDSADSLTE